MKKFNEQWINLLTGDKLDKQLEFEEILATSKCEMLAIMKMRRLQMQEREQITLQDLKNVWNNDARLTEILQELFLEPVLVEHIEFFYKNASEKYSDMMDALEELYNRAMRDRGLRFLTIALTI